MPGAPSRPEVLAWLESLSDFEVLRRMRELVPSFDHDPDDMGHNWDILEKMRDDALAFAQQHDTGARATPVIPESA